MLRQEVSNLEVSRMFQVWRERVAPPKGHKPDPTGRDDFVRYKDLWEIRLSVSQRVDLTAAGL